MTNVLISVEVPDDTPAEGLMDVVEKAAIHAISRAEETYSPELLEQTNGDVYFRVAREESYAGILILKR